MSVPELLHDIFHQTAMRYPRRIALRLAESDPETARKSELTYWELRSRAARFAHHLVRRGVKRGDRVMVCLPRGLDQYMAVLGILEIGAAYVPVDWQSPQERVDSIALACQAAVTNGDRSAAFPGSVLCKIIVDRELGDIAALGPLPAGSPTAQPDDLAYVIYTSGSTGQPKGAMIRHRNIAFQVQSEASILKLTRDDIVYAGASLAFDVSVEEMWAAFVVGATLLVGSESLTKAIDELPVVLEARQVTVWCPVPSLLAAIPHPWPSLRVLNVGGEACPAVLVRRWAGGSCTMINTYGPTETSVSATWTILTPDKPVTIGKPLPGFQTWVVDDALVPVPPGEEGELLIGGPGVGAGYLDDPVLTARKFVQTAFAEWAYRTGDLVRLNRDGDLEFRGRADLQVKIRGYRVELEEIEAILQQDPAVAQAVVKLCGGPGEPQTLVAFVMVRRGHAIVLDALRALAAAKLPDYMRPGGYVIQETMPLLVSGKIDRKALRQPAGVVLKVLAPIEIPQTPLEEKLTGIWNQIFAPLSVSPDDDFFENLGGHSLRAAHMVSLAREDAELRSIAIRDLYAAPTIAKLARRLTQQRHQRATVSEVFHDVPRGRHLACAAAQTLAGALIFAFSGAQWVLPYLVYTIAATADPASRGPALVAAGLVFMVMPPLMMLFSIAVKWIVIGRFKAGEYPLWGAYYFRWWLVRRFLAAVPTAFLGGTPMLAVYFRLLGAKLGAGVFLQSNNIDAPDLVSIGPGAVVGQDAILATTAVEHGLLRIGGCRIGAGAVVGAMAVIGRDATLGDGAVLEDLSALSPGATIAAGDVWTGSPAQPRTPKPGPRTVPPSPSRLRRALVTFGLSIVAALLPLIAVLPIAPGLIGMIELDWITDDYSYIALSPLLASIYVLAMCVLTVAAKWALLGRVRPGAYSMWSWFYIRFWCVQKLGELALELLHPIYATLYVRPWYRALGARVGPRAEISTAASVVHDLVSIGAESFIADAVQLGTARCDAGVLELSHTKIGRRTFIGNSALLPSGSILGDEVLIGVLSKPPDDGHAALEAGSTWFGSPPIRLPHRQIVAQFNEGARFNPSGRLIAKRLGIEFVRIILPLTVFIALFCLLLTIAGDLSDLPHGAWWVFGLFPFLYFGFVIAIGAFVIVLKWLVIGRYKPMVTPLWSGFVWRTELVTSTYENLVVPLLLEPIRGTPYINMFLRLMGCHIGRRVFTDTTDITEFDLVSVGDDAALNESAGLQTHLFEDRVMKCSNISIGKRVTIGSQSIVLYDSVMEDDSHLGDLSVLMKGETLPSGTAWQGSPARRAGEG